MTQAKTIIALTRAAGCALALATSLAASSADAQSILDSWSSVTIPPPPAVQPVTVDSAKTALLMLDFSVESCGRRPTCVRSIPLVAHLLNQARAHHMMVVYSTGGLSSPKTPDVLTALPDEPSVHSGVDKFLGTKLQDMLTAKGIQTVIVVGTSAHGAVLYTASSAALRGFAVVVPVDGYSAENPFAEVLTAWQLKNAPASVSAHVTLTKTDTITMK